MQTQQQQMQQMAASQQFLAAQQNAAYAAQQAAPYVINPGQDAAPYMGLIAAQMPQYYGVAPWGMYPGNLIPQQSTQPRRPLTPSQQGAENQSYQVRKPINIENLNQENAVEKNIHNIQKKALNIKFV